MEGSNGGLLKCVLGPLSLWSRCLLRKPRKCELCGEEIMPGEPAFRPLTEFHGMGLYRYMRIHEDCALRRREPQSGGDSGQG